ncbi:MAG: VanW family protein [Eubacteriales bacterium]
MSGFPKKYLLVLAVLAAQVFVSIIGGLVFASTPRENVIFPGVFISGIDVGGLTRDQAMKTMEQNVADKLKTVNIMLKYGKRQWPLSFREIGVVYDIPATVENALKIGRRHKYFDDSLMIFRIRNQKPDLPLQFSLDESKLKDVMAGVSSEINARERDAGFSISEGHLIVQPEARGREFRLQENIKKIKENLASIQNLPVMAEVSETAPRINVSDLSGIKDSIGLGVTVFPRSNKEISQNVLLVVQKLNGTLIKPGESFSFNQNIGQAVNESGYRQPVLIDGRLTEESSGGASRVASALYQAVLYSGLRVRERHAHFTSPGYVTQGQDAAVAYGNLDLRFENTTKGSIYIHTYTKGTRVMVNLLGSKTDGQTIQVDTQETAANGQKGPSGTLVKVYRVFYNGGVKVGRELISEDNYR